MRCKLTGQIRLEPRRDYAENKVLTPLPPPLDPWNRLLKYPDYPGHEEEATRFYATQTCHSPWTAARQAVHHYRV